MKEKFLFTGVGQCGNNFAYGFEKRNYLAHCINSSNKDLQSVNCRSMYHIPGAFGCNKNQTVALNYAKTYWESMAEVIDQRFPRQTIIYFIFSLGGGTGSGVAPALLKLMIRRNPHKNYGAIIVLPDLNESHQSIENALNTYQKITAIEGLKNVFVLDNSNEDKFKINEIFIDRFDAIVNMANPSMKGVVDESEIEAVLACRGNSVIEEWTDEPIRSFSTNIFTSYKSGCEYAAFTTQKEINPRDFHYKTGKPTTETYIGYNNKRNLFIASGMPFPEDRIRDLLVKHKVGASSSSISPVRYDIPKRKENNGIMRDQQIDEPKQIDDVDAIFDEFL